MSPITRFHRRLVCHLIGCHELDWIFEQMTGVRRCSKCEHPIPGLTVRDIHPDSGD